MRWQHHSARPRTIACAISGATKTRRPDQPTPSSRPTHHRRPGIAKGNVRDPAPIHQHGRTSATVPDPGQSHMRFPGRPVQVAPASLKLIAPLPKAVVPAEAKRRAGTSHARHLHGPAWHEPSVQCRANQHRARSRTIAYAISGATKKRRPDQPTPSSRSTHHRRPGIAKGNVRDPAPIHQHGRTSATVPAPGQSRANGIPEARRPASKNRRPGRSEAQSRDLPRLTTARRIAISKERRCHDSLIEAARDIDPSSRGYLPRSDSASTDGASA